jgi:hypothetical protein
MRLTPIRPQTFCVGEAKIVCKSVLVAGGVVLRSSYLGLPIYEASGVVTILRVSH